MYILYINVKHTNLMNICENFLKYNPCDVKSLLYITFITHSFLQLKLLESSETKQKTTLPLKPYMQ